MSEPNHMTKHHLAARLCSYCGRRFIGPNSGNVAYCTSVCADEAKAKILTLAEKGLALHDQ